LKYVFPVAERRVRIGLDRSDANNGSAYMKSGFSFWFWLTLIFIFVLYCIAWQRPFC